MFASMLLPHPQVPFQQGARGANSLAGLHAKFNELQDVCAQLHRLKQAPNVARQVSPGAGRGIAPNVRRQVSPGHGVAPNVRRQVSPGHGVAPNVTCQVSPGRGSAPNITQHVSPLTRPLSPREVLGGSMTPGSPSPRSKAPLSPRLGSSASVPPGSMPAPWSNAPLSPRLASSVSGPQLRVREHADRSLDLARQVSATMPSPLSPWRLASGRSLSPSPSSADVLKQTHLGQSSRQPSSPQNSLSMPGPFDARGTLRSQYQTAPRWPQKSRLAKASVQQSENLSSRAVNGKHINKCESPPASLKKQAAPANRSTHAPVHACDYQANSMDPMDAVFSWELLNLDRQAASQLTIARSGVVTVPDADGGRELCGQYFVAGRPISVRWNGDGSDELLVYEHNIGDDSFEIPLSAYLAQAANVTASLRGSKSHVPAIARLAPESRLTFFDATSSPPTLGNLDGSDRCKWMRVACEQASLREQQAGVFGRLGPN